MIGIYKIEHLPTGNKYIGSSKQVEIRFNQHKNNLRKNKHHSSKLQSSWNKSSEEKFSFELIEECKISELLEREDFYIQHFDSFKNGYNMTESVFKFWKTYSKYKKEIRQEKYKVEYAELKELAETIGINIYYNIAPTKVGRVRRLLEYYIENCNWEHFEVQIESYRPKVTLRILYKGDTIDFIMTKGGKIFTESSFPYWTKVLDDFYEREKESDIRLYKEG